MKKLLALNRSEIAIRILRAANELGLRTVAIYSKEDRLALHRFKADEAYLIGEGKGPVEAYLDVEGIVALAKEKGVDAIHPGYGFLSENPALPRACERAGITFVGPSARSARPAGRQDRRAAAWRRRPAFRVVPGHRGSRHRSRSRPRRSPREIGYPADRQGRLRRRRTRHARGGQAPRSSPASWKRRAAKRPPRSATTPSSWNASCAAPSTSKCRSWATGTATSCTSTSAIARCSAAIRKWSRSRPRRRSIRRSARALADAAVTLARAAGYVNAGTVEFLVDVDTGEWYFIEVNPRIQVEHTVTEMVTGIDLVRCQIQVAQGLDAARPGDEPAAAGPRAALRLRAAVPHHHRGPGQQLRPRLRQDPHLPLARRLRHPARRRLGLRRRGHHAVLRFAAGEDHGLGPRVPRTPASAWTARCASSASAA